MRLGNDYARTQSRGLRLQQLAHRYLFGWYGVLPLGFEFLVVAHKGVAWMFAGHQHTPRRCAHGVAGIVRRKPHAFARKLVEVWRLDFLLAVGTQFRPTEIIGHDQDDIRRRSARHAGQDKKSQKRKTPPRAGTLVPGRPPGRGRGR